MQEVIRLEREALNQRQPKIFYTFNWLVRLAARITHFASKLLHIKPIFTPYSIAVLESNSNISHDKATRELGYQPRPLLETFRDSLAWMSESGRTRRTHKSASQTLGRH